MYEIRCQIKGDVPMLHDRYCPQLEVGKQGQKGTKKASTMEEIEADVIRRTHRDKTGLYVPTRNLRYILIGNRARPGAAAILGKYIETKKGAEYVQFVKSNVWIYGEKKTPDKVYYKPNKKTHDRIHMDTFVTGSGGAVIRKDIYRACVDAGWTIEFNIHVLDDSYAESKIREMYTVAGLRCGLGAFGPEFGRFSITKWQVK